LVVVVNAIDLGEPACQHGRMRWCDRDQNDFADTEFVEVDGVLYHERGGRHLAGELLLREELEFLGPDVAEAEDEG
jgi:hypothetical protein